MKWIIILLVVAAGAWIFFNVDFSNFHDNATNTIKEEKTLKKFFAEDQANKQETEKTVKENFY